MEKIEKSCLVDKDYLFRLELIPCTTGLYKNIYNHKDYDAICLRNDVYCPNSVEELGRRYCLIDNDIVDSLKGLEGKIK